MNQNFKTIKVQFFKTSELLNFKFLILDLREVFIPNLSLLACLEPKVPGGWWVGGGWAVVVVESNFSVQFRLRPENQSEAQMMPEY